jgi:rhodanese-related sulfurtransferase
MSEEREADFMSNISEISIEELCAAIACGETSCIIDVREPVEYAAGRISCARLIPLGQLERRAAEISRTSAVYVICRTGRRAAEAQARLTRMGLDNVRTVAGGMAAWQLAGLPMEADLRVPWALERQVRIAAGSLVLLGVLLSVAVADWFIWVAGFIGAGLVFAGVTDTCAMGMMISRMPWNRVGERSREQCSK